MIRPLKNGLVALEKYLLKQRLVWWCRPRRFIAAVDVEGSVNRMDGLFALSEEWVVSLLDQCTVCLVHFRGKGRDACRAGRGTKVNFGGYFISNRRENT